MDLDLCKFNMASIASDSVVIFVGKRNTGKSFLTRDLLYHHQDIPVGTVICATEGVNGFYSKIVPKLFIHEDYHETIVENFMKRQRRVVSKLQQSGNKSQIDTRAFLILDDCLYDNSWTKSVNIRAVFMNGRHLGIFFIVTMQYALGIPPQLRTNIDFVFILRENIHQNRKRIYECYAGVFQEFGLFCQVMDQCTNNFECLVINNTIKENGIEKQAFWYKADARPDFKMGANTFWEHSEKHFNTNCQEEDNQFSLDKIKKNKFLVNVKKNNTPNTDYDASINNMYNEEQTQNYYSNMLNRGNYNGDTNGNTYNGDYYSGY